MADRYCVADTTQSAAAEAFDAVVVAVGADNPAEGKRGWIYDCMMGATTAADNQIVYRLSRLSSIAATLANTPTALDPNAPAALLVGGHVTASCTIGDDLLAFAANQRSTQRWVAAPGGELGVLNTADTGIGLTAVCSATPTIECSIHFEE